MNRLVKLAALIVSLGFFQTAQAQQPVIVVNPLFDVVLQALQQALELGPERTQLEQLRNPAYIPSSAAANTATNVGPKRADLLTRPITLEGQDLRTQERSDAYAKEVVRQRQLASVIEKLCREAFGSENCELKREQILDPQQAQEILRQRERSYVTDPLALAQIPIKNGALAVLDSGTPDYQQKARETLEEARTGGPVNPLVYSPEIAEARKRLSGPALDKFNEYVKDVKSQILGKPINVNTWIENLEAATSKQGEVAINTDTPCPSRGSCADDKLKRSYQTVNEGINVKKALFEIASQATQRVTAQIGATIVDNAIPDRAQVPRTGFESDTIGDIRIVDTAPANVKVGLQRELLPLLAQVIAKPDFVDPAQVDSPGGTSAVDRDEQGNFPELDIGQPLAPFEDSKVIKEGLYHHSGVTLVPGLHLGNFLQEAIPEIIKNIRP